MSWLEGLGISVDKVEDTLTNLDEILESARTTAEYTAGYDDDARELGIELSQAVIDGLEGTELCFDTLGKDIIETAQNAAIEALNDSVLFDDLSLAATGIEFGISVDGIECFDPRDIEILLYDRLAAAITERVCEKYDKTYDEDFRKVIQEKLENGVFDAEDVYACVHNREIAGTVEKVAAEYVDNKPKSKNKPDMERN